MVGHATSFDVKVAGYIAKHGLLMHGGKYLVALSGGADSVALLLCLSRLGYRVEAAHCNFHLRGEESDRDEYFCMSLCESIGIPIHVTHFDTVSYASRHKVSIEMAARDLRYGYFNSLAENIGANGICVAHHMDDNAETVIMNLVRGTGVRGLAGMRPLNGRVARPFLCVSREMILGYLGEIGQGYVTDSTNLERDATRNKVRLDVIPMLQTINPSAVECIARTAEWLAGAADVYESALDDSMADVARKIGEDTLISLEKLRQRPSGEAVLFRILSPLGFTSVDIAEAWESSDGQPGKEWACKTHRLLLDRGRFILYPKDGGIGEVYMEIPAIGEYDDCKFSFSIGKTDVGPGFHIPKGNNIVAVDSAAVSFPLLLRTVERGDSFVPFGMRGRKLVSDFLTDRKSTLREKREQLALCNSDGEIIWLVGHRISDRFKVSDGTKEAYMLGFVITLHV